MSLASHKVIFSILSILATFIQAEFQSTFIVHRWTMCTFFIVFSIYGVSCIKDTRNDNDGGVLSLLVGALASILLLIIILPVLGWVPLGLWILYSLKTSYELIIRAFWGAREILKVRDVKVKSSFHAFRLIILFMIKIIAGLSFFGCMVWIYCVIFIKIVFISDLIYGFCLISGEGSVYIITGSHYSSVGCLHTSIN